MPDSVPRVDSPPSILTEERERRLTVGQDRPVRISSGHRILHHDGKCSRPHGHNYEIQVKLTGTLTDDGWIADKGDITRIIKQWDHRFLVEEGDPLVEAFEASGDGDSVIVLDHPPTAEVMSAVLERRLSDELGENITGIAVEVRETGQLCAGAHSVSLPCQPDCPYMRPWERDFDNIDLLIGHLSHAYSPRVIDERVVFVDEDPEDSFERTFSSGEANKIASAYLRSLDSIPADDVDHVDDVERLLDIARDEHRVSLGRRAMEDRDFDVHGPEVVRTFFEPEVDDTDTDRDSYRVDLLNGAQHIRLSERVTAARLYSSKKLCIREVPDFNEAAALVALDGTPVPSVWRGRLGVSELEHSRVLCDECRERYLTDVLGYRIVQVDPHVRALSSPGDREKLWDQARGLLHEVSREASSGVGLITTNVAKDHVLGRDDGNEFDIDEDDDTNHYHNLKGSNEFQGDRIQTGVVFGCPHPGSREVELLAALDGVAYEHDRVEVSPDGSTYTANVPLEAEEYLTHFRENEVAQAVLRFGRTSGATVFVFTSAVPDWLDQCYGSGSVDRRLENEQAVLQAVSDTSEATVARIHETLDDPPSKKTIRRKLKSLCEEGLLERDESAKEHRYIVRDHDASPTAKVDLPTDAFDGR